MTHVSNTVHSPNNFDQSLDAIPGPGMSKSQRELWERINRFEIGDAAWALSFTKRLARENAWSEAFAARVVAEYKRFVFLLLEAGHPVTPSDEVDQAWHLHMVYTRSYWIERCGELLGRALHHGPTKGGAAEGAKFEDWFGRTLASYARLFGQSPPREIWPDARTRFGRAPQFARVNTSENWVISKPRVRRSTLAGAAMLLVAGGLAGCEVMMAQTTTPARGSLSVGAMIIVAITLMLGAIVLVKRWFSRPTSAHLRDGKSNTGSGCSPFILGGMTGGESSSREEGGKDHDGSADDSGGETGGDTGGDSGGSSDSGPSGCSSSGCGGGGCGGDGGGGD